MDQKWFISRFFGVFCFLYLSNFFHAASYTLSNSGNAYNDIDSNPWESHRDQFPVLRKNFQNNKFKEEDGNLSEQPTSNVEDKRWLNVLTFDKRFNLTEKDEGPQNETKKIFINAEEHLKIFENEEKDDEEDEDSQLQEGEKNIFHLLSPEGFFSEMISQNQSRALERTKRQAEDGKRKCRCRRKRRRGMSRRRRRRRRNRTGQQRPARRRRQRGGRRRNGRRGRRRCVCRKKGDGGGSSGDGDGGGSSEDGDGGKSSGDGDGDGEGKSEGGEEPEVEEADGEEEGTTEGGDETAAEGDGEEGDGGEGEGEEGSEEESDEEDEESEDDEESSSMSEGEMPSLNNIPTYMFPYPNMIETPIAMMPVGVPIASYPRSSTPLYKMPSYLAVGSLLSGNNNSNTEE